jgi:hypothetical protein
MNYFLLNGDLEVIATSSKFPGNDSIPARKPADGVYRGRDTVWLMSAGWTDRNDWETLADAERIAASATKATGKTWLACDRGEHTSPRYDVIEAPVVGQEVSHGFNGDAYPLGKITKISPDFKTVMVLSKMGVRHRFTRRGAGWINKGWSLLPGSQYRQNPEF